MSLTDDQLMHAQLIPLYVIGGLMATYTVWRAVEYLWYASLQIKADEELND